MAYDSIEPISTSHQLETLAFHIDWNVGNIVKTLINLFGRKAGSPATPLEDCVLDFTGKRSKREQSVAQMKAIFKSLAPNRHVGK